jgi:nucleoside-diphosphate-sugar epimerase
MRVFLAGGTGAVGGHVVPALIGDGHEVSALARTEAKAQRLRDQGAAPVRTSLFDETALTRAFAGHDAVVNLATAIPAPARFALARAWRPNDLVRTLGSAAVAAAARHAGVPRLVQESITFMYPDRGAEWIDEDVALAPVPRTRPNEQAEQNARTFGAGCVVLRFGLFYGPGSDLTELILRTARRHAATAFGRPDDYFAFCHLADAAGAVLAAVTAPPDTYNVCDDEPLTWREQADAIAAAVGVRAWLRAPGRLTRLAGDRAAPFSRSLRVRNTRLRAATGWSPRYPSTRDGWRATVAATS